MQKQYWVLNIYVYDWDLCKSYCPMPVCAGMHTPCSDILLTAQDFIIWTMAQHSPVHEQKP